MYVEDRRQLFIFLQNWWSLTQRLSCLMNIKILSGCH